MAFIAMIEQLLGRHEQAHALLTETLATQPHGKAGHRAAHRARQGALLRRRLARDAPLRRGRAGGGAGTRRPAADRLGGRHPGAGRVPPAGRRRRPAAARRGRRPARRADRRPARGPAGRGPVRRLGRAVPGPLGRRPPPLRARARRRARHRPGLPAGADDDRAHDRVPLAGRARAPRPSWPTRRSRPRACPATPSRSLDADDALLGRDAGRRPRARARAPARRRTRPPSDCRAATGARSPRAIWPRRSLEAGDPDAARKLLLPELQFVERAFQTRWYEVLTRAELAAGRFTEADRHAAHAEMAASGLGLPARTSEARRARAAVLLAARRQRRRHPRRADRRARGAPRRQPARRGPRAAARGPGAGRRRPPPRGDRRADRRPRDLHRRRRAPLRRPGRARAAPPRPPRRAPGPRRRRPEAGVGALTDREREIAALVADGHTNRRIAAHLHLSTKTVETHVANIFGKLGVRSRAAVAATIART